MCCNFFYQNGPVLLMLKTAVECSHSPRVMFLKCSGYLMLVTGWAEADCHILYLFCRLIRFWKFWNQPLLVWTLAFSLHSNCAVLLHNFIVFAHTTPPPTDNLCLIFQPCILGHFHLFDEGSQWPGQEMCALLRTLAIMCPLILSSTSLM